jgi:hypothetical protein
MRIGNDMGTLSDLYVPWAHSGFHYTKAYIRMFKHSFFGHQSATQEQHHHDPEEQAGFAVVTGSHEAALQGNGIVCLWR